MSESAVNLEFDDWPSAIGALLKSWRHEVGLALGGRNSDVSSGDRAVLDLSRPEIILRRRGRAGGEETVSIAPGEPTEISARIGEAVRSLGAPSEITLMLPASEVFRPSLQLPSVRQSQLVGALNYELERLSPVHPSQLYFDYQVLNRDPNTGMASIALRAVRRSVVDGALSLARGAGVSVNEILFDKDDIAADSHAFPVDRSARLYGLWRRYGLRLLLVWTVMLAALLIYSIHARNEAILEDVTGQVDEYRHIAQSVDRLQHDVVQTRQQMEFLRAERQRPLLVATLRDVTQLLPDDTWIVELDTSGQQLTLEGISGNASGLIKLFDASANFANASFSAPLTQDVATKADRFHMTVEARGVSQ